MARNHPGAANRKALDAGGGVYADVEREGSTLVVAFGGLLNRFGEIPVFEFLSSIEGVDPLAKRVFLRDLEQVWYQRGVEGLGSTVDQVGARLRALVRESGAERPVMVGASAGGFAAILFGALTGATEVHAFGPQTFLDRFRRARYFDFRHRRQIEALRAGPPDASSYLDLRPVVAAAAAAGRTPRYVIHYSARNRLDRVHARRMRALPGVELRAYPFAQHNVLAGLRDRGELAWLLKEIVAAPS